LFFPANPLVDCGDFWILDNTLIRFSWKDFSDKDGNVVRSEAKYSFDDDLYHEDYPDGIHLFGNAQANHQWLIEDDEVTAHKVSGLPVGITVPGYGPLFFEAGMWIGVDDEMVFLAGKHKDWIEEDFAANCDYFRNQ